MKSGSKPTPLFVNPESISSYLHCVICQEVFTNPLRLNCGHTFCSECIKHWFSSRYKCPTCRAKVTDFGKDLLAYDIVNDLEVRCNNGKKGCPWKGPLGHLEQHLKVCEESLKILLDKKKKEESEGKKKEENKREEKKKKKKSSIKRKCPGIPKDENGKENIINALIELSDDKKEVTLTASKLEKIKEVFKTTKEKKKQSLPLTNKQDN